jgi:hypothetical protein
MGGGGSNFTGSYSATASVVPAVAQNTSLSGYVSGPGAIALAGVVVTLTGTDSQGNPVTLTATTDTHGFYSFADLQAGTYTVERPQPPNYYLNQSNAGRVDGVTDGTVLLDGDIAQITIRAGDEGTNYDFGEIYAGS